MKKKRINDAVLASIPVQNGQILKGEHLAILREILAAGVNENKYDIDRIVAGQDAVHVYGGDVEALNKYASENTVVDETLGYLYTENQILLHKYLGDTWNYLGVLNLTEFFGKTQELDAHLIDLDNPHAVTAEQVDTYNKTTIDNKDADTLQEAKDYTYSQVEIDNKDADTLQQSKDYTYSKAIIDNKDTAVLQQAKDYTYSKVEIDNKDTAIMNKANNLENANMFKDVNYNNVNGVLTFTKYDDTTKVIDLPLELLVNSGYYDEATNELVLVLVNSSEIKIPVGNLLTDLDAHNIRFNGSGTNYLVNKLDVESAVKELDTRVKANDDGKQDKLIAGENISIVGNTISASGGGGSVEIDLNEMAYFNYATNIYGAKHSLLVNAWEHSLTVDPLEISAIGSSENIRGLAEYPNAETEGIIIPQGVTSIGEYAFHTPWTPNNQPLVIPDSVTSIGDRAFYNWTLNNHPLVIPNSVTSIGPHAFRGWSSNNQPLVIPSSVTSMGTSAFEGWTSNNQPLTIQNGVTTIGGSMFHNWTSNNQPLVIPSSVTSIGEMAFYNWLSVPYIEMKSTTPPTLSAPNAFGYQNDAPIYVPDASVTAYKTATNWLALSLTDRIFPVSDMISGSSGGGEVNIWRYE